MASPVARAGPVLAPALSPERLHSFFAFRFIQIHPGKPKTQIFAFNLEAELVEEAPCGPCQPWQLAEEEAEVIPLGNSCWWCTCPSSPAWTVSFGHTHVEFSSVWSSLTAADVAGGRGELSELWGMQLLTVTLCSSPQPRGLLGYSG